MITIHRLARLANFAMIASHTSDWLLHDEGAQQAMEACMYVCMFAQRLGKAAPPAQGVCRETAVV